ncbi:hypothetical protein ACIG5E_37880 [Kitasatospora sp. NPDC053057]|uniref:hypothetical protein n=1 Tax=Kitasatospora sp. NPDC053057 TaxID=3364062 RepID=UPI0037C7B50E
MFVDLAPHSPGPGARGFVDAEHLRARDQWPPAGTDTDFEVLRHDLRRAEGTPQVRLWPLDAAVRHPRAGHWGLPDEQWQRVKARHPVGSTVTATVSSLSAGNRWYTVTFGEARSRITHPAAGPPPLGATPAATGSPASSTPPTGSRPRRWTTAPPASTDPAPQPRTAPTRRDTAVPRPKKPVSARVPVPNLRAGT